MLTHRQRVQLALEHQEADRVPIDFGSTFATTINHRAYANLVHHLGLDAGSGAIMRRRSQAVIPSEEILQRFDVDTRGLWLGSPDRAKDRDLPDGSFLDEWQVLWSKPEEGHYINIRGPFQGDGEPVVTALERFPWPDPWDDGRVRGLRERAVRLYEGTDYAIVLSLPYGILSTCQFLRGFAEFYSDLIVNRAFAQGLIEHVTAVVVGIAEAALREVGDLVDVVYVGDDLGIQTGPLMSPDLYRKILKPFHAQLFAAIKRRSRAKILLHSCGSVYRLIGDLIDVGVDALNPVQVAAAEMDTAVLKREFGSRLVFWGGGVDTQRVLPYGTRDEVREEVRRRIADLAPGGGYVFTQVHNIQAEVPPVNIIAMFEAAHEFGRYA